jgi:predicted ATPase
LLRATRRQYHGQIAQLFERQFPEIGATQPELVAHHYTEAGETEQALRYWRQAGRRAARRSANAEAIAHLTRGLEILSGMPDTPQCAQLEIDFQMSLGPALIAVKGHGAGEVNSTYSRARELCEQIGDTQRLSRVLAGLCAYYTARGPYTTAYEMAERALELAEERGERRLLLQARTNLGVNAYLLGRFTTARAHLEQGISLAALQPPGESPAQDFGVTCHAYSALTLFSLGYPDKALERSRASVQVARDLNLPFSLAFALYIASHLHRYRREPEAMLAYADEGIALCKEQKFALWLGGATAQRGWALVELGRIDEGVGEIRQGMDAWLATGAEVAKPYFLALLADAERRLGRCAEGMRMLDEGLAVVEELRDKFYEAEIHRLKGELILQQHVEAGTSSKAEDEAEASYRQALRIARDQCAKSWELRAAMSLARLWRRLDRREEAHAILAPVYEWFTEGLETRDLSQAKALLERLN